MKPMVAQESGGAGHAAPADRAPAVPGPPDTPTRHLGMTLRVYRTSPGGERVYLPVARAEGSRNGSYPACSCPRCRRAAPAV